MSVKEQLLSTLVKSPAIKLNPDEICFFQASAKLGTPRRESVSTTSTKPGIGVGLKLTKHLGVGIGRQRTTTITEHKTVWEQDPCIFLILNDCLMLKFAQRNVAIRYDTITDLKVNKDALTVSCGQQAYYIFMKHSDIDSFIKTYKLLGEAGKEGLDIKSLIPGANGAETSSKNGVSYIYAQTIFLWSVGRKATQIMNRADYPKYLFYDCSIQNAPKFHQDMIQSGYLEPAPIADNLSTLKLTELKEILKNNGISNSGSKADLVALIIENVSEQELSALFPNKKYVLSDKGRAFLNEHADYIKLKEHQNWQISIAEYDMAKTGSRSFYDVCWGILNSRIARTDNLIEHRNVCYNMYSLLKEENKNSVAMEMLIRTLYYDMNSLSSGYMNAYMQGRISKKEFLERASSEVFFAPAIIKEIGDMEKYFSDDMITKLYSRKTAFYPCSEALFSEIVHAIIAGDFNADYFKQRIIKDYKKA